jgi:hypothetical protein
VQHALVWSPHSCENNRVYPSEGTSQMHVHIYVAVVGSEGRLGVGRVCQPLKASRRLYRASLEELIIL